jgi:preprotein translocase SecF subunit
LSFAIVVGGIVVMWTNGIRKGVEFAGGTVVIEQFEQPVSVEQVRAALEQNFGQDLIINVFGDPSQRQMMIRVPQVGEESGASLGETAAAIDKALASANLPAARLGSEIVGPAVGAELTSRAIWAVMLSLVGILAYISFRFQLSFAVGAVVATIHDLAVTLAFLSFFEYDLTLNVIAALLTIAGYSTNDTIVIFDRVRENLRSMRRDSLSHVINVAVNQTLSRTVITGGTALLSALALLLFGGDVLKGFAFTMTVGVVAGTYSTVFIAAAIVSFWRGAGPTRAAARAPATAAASQQPTRRSKPQRKARAS